MSNELPCEHIFDAQYSSTVHSSSTEVLYKKITKSVSFVYILHRSNSGFVTYRKSRSDSIREYVSSYNDTQFRNIASNSIKNWRESLSLNESNNVLVAFAWAQNKEIKTSEKHPHFLACDITFGVNRQRRDFF